MITPTSSPNSTPKHPYIAMRELKEISLIQAREVLSNIDSAIEVIKAWKIIIPEKSPSTNLSIRNWYDRKKTFQNFKDVKKNKIKELKKLLKQNHALCNNLIKTQDNFTKIRELSEKIILQTNMLFNILYNENSPVSSQKRTNDQNLERIITPIQDGIKALDLAQKSKIDFIWKQLIEFESSVTNSNIDNLENQKFISTKLQVEVDKVRLLKNRILPFKELMYSPPNGLIPPASSTTLKLCDQVHSQLLEIQNSHNKIKWSLPEFIKAKEDLSKLSANIEKFPSLYKKKYNLKHLDHKIEQIEKKLLKNGNTSTSVQVDNFVRDVQSLTAEIEKLNTNFTYDTTGPLVKLLEKQNELSNLNKDLKAKFKKMELSLLELAPEAKSTINVNLKILEEKIQSKEKEILNNANNRERLNKIFDSYDTLIKDVNLEISHINKLHTAIKNHNILDNSLFIAINRSRSILNINHHRKLFINNLNNLSTSKDSTTLSTYLLAFDQENIKLSKERYRLHEKNYLDILSSIDQLKTTSKIAPIVQQIELLRIQLDEKSKNIYTLNLKKIEESIRDLVNLTIELKNVLRTLQQDKSHTAVNLKYEHYLNELNGSENLEIEKIMAKKKELDHKIDSQDKNFSLEMYVREVETLIKDLQEQQIKHLLNNCENALKKKFGDKFKGLSSEEDLYSEGVFDETNLFTDFNNLSEILTYMRKIEDELVNNRDFPLETNAKYITELKKIIINIQT